MIDWMRGYESLPVPGVSGGAWASDGPDRVVLHTTEGASIEGAFAAYKMSGSLPHITVDPGRRRKAQHLPLSRSATAVRNLSGGTETNRIGVCIQIEMIGHAADPPSTDAELAFLHQVLLDLQDAGVDFQLIEPSAGFHPYPPENGIRLDGREPWRMTNAEWARFNGVCGHQHVPENVHGDPGALDMTRVLAAKPPTPQEDDMKTTLVAGPDGRLWALTVNALHNGKRHVSSLARLADILFLDGVTLGATLVSQTPVKYGQEYLDEYPTMGEPAEVHVSITDADVARIAAQVAELAKLSPEDIKALAGGLVAGMGSALSNG